MHHLMRRLCLATLILMIIALAACAGTARAAAPSCSLHVPAITEQADGTGVQTGHVTGSCNFAWHSRDEIWYKDRWHMLGWNWHAGGAAGVLVSQPKDFEDYGEYGKYKEVVSVFNSAGTLVLKVVGPVSNVQ